tara:strand:- start:1217 stop:1336 length:120 start_codon:yes stop_codon:yes gene_type:complete
MREWDHERSGDGAKIKLEFGFWFALALVGTGSILIWALA